MPRRAEPLTIEEEKQLWQCRLLEDHSLQALLDTMLFLCGMYFALHSGQKHRNLVMLQIKIVEPMNGLLSYIAYTEIVSKNHSGRLAQRKVEPKQMIHHQNLENPSWGLVRLMKLYLSHCPKPQPQTFYLAPLTKPKSDVWYSSNPVGHNTLGNTMPRCWYLQVQNKPFTESYNTTRLFQHGVDEQLIMTRTSHRSVSGVHTRGCRMIKRKPCQVF